MTIFLAVLLILSLISGQLVKIPLFGNSSLTLLDISIIFLNIISLWNIKFRLKKPPLFLLLAIIFIFIALLSLIFTPLKLSFSEYLNSLAYIVRFSSFIFLGWVFYSGAFKNLQKKLIPKILVISGSILAFLGLLQLIFLPDLRFLSSQGWDPHFFRTVSTLLDPNFAGIFFVLTLLILLSHLGGGIILTPRVKYFVFTLIYLALLTTFSRSSYLMFLVSGVTLSVFKKSKSTFILVILLFLGLILGFTIYTKVVAQPRNIDRSESASFRLNTWQQGLQIFSQNPILGVGFNSYRYALKQYNLASEQEINSHGGTSNDSSLLFVASTTGIIGFLSYIIMIISLIIYSIQKSSKNGNRYILASGIIGLIIISFFVNSLFYPWVLIWIILIYTNLKLVYPKPSKVEKSELTRI